MKFIYFIFLISFLTIGNVYSQVKPTKARDLVALNLEYDLKGVQDLTVEQRNKLIDIELRIDKEYPYLTNYVLLSEKKQNEKLKAIFALREKFYPSVLTTKQLEQWMLSVNKNKEILNGKPVKEKKQSKKQSKK